jgi:hypothetical protein
MHDRAQQLIADLAHGASSGLAQELLDEFFEGLPPEHLRPVLFSSNDDAVKAGAWIASELGARARPLLNDIRNLLKHRSGYVRFFLLDVILSAATEDDGEIIAAAVGLVEDQDERVRWKAMTFLARSSQQQLAAALPHVTAGRLHVLSHWLVELASTTPGDSILERLRSNDPLTRRFAGSAAARVAGVDRSLLRAAAASNDEEICSFAKGWLNRVASAAPQ